MFFCLENIFVFLGALWDSSKINYDENLGSAKTFQKLFFLLFSGFCFGISLEQPRYDVTPWRRGFEFEWGRPIHLKLYFVEGRSIKAHVLYHMNT